MCLYPRLIKNRKYAANKKNGGQVPEVTDPRVLYVPVGCQECIECRRQKAREWMVRLTEDIKKNKNGKFITLTFSNESIKSLCERENLRRLNGYDLDNGIAITAMKLWRERWRKQYKTSIRHWLVTELGHTGTENIHMHGIVWCDAQLEELRKTWQYGFVWVGQYVNTQTINYIIKYVTKMDEKHKLYRAKILTSPGIGSNYTETYNATKNSYNGTETEEYYRTQSGHKIGLPIYWRNKLYKDTEKEKLWLHKLDKNTRWVCGEKIKADDTETYFKLLEWHRKKNTQLGYGDGKRDEKYWNRKEYEKAQREILTQTRIQNASSGGLNQKDLDFNGPGPMPGEPG